MEELKDFTQPKRSSGELSMTWKKKKGKGRGPPLQGSICFPSRFMLERTGKQVDIAISHSA